MEEVVCAVCVQFEPQTWRKSLCKNCFHGLEEHTEDVDKTPAVTQKYESDKNEEKTTGAKTQETDKAQLATLKTGKDRKQASASIPKTSPKSPTKTTTASLSSKFGSVLSKNTDNGKTDTGKATGKLTTVSSKSTTEATKRASGSISKQTTAVKLAGKVTDKKLNGADSKLKTSSLKESNSSVKDSSVTRLGHKSGETKTVDAKALQPSQPAQVSKSDNNKSAGSSSRYASTGGVNKVKHLLRSFGSGDEPADAHDEKKALSDLDKHATRTESDVTAKCQASEGSHVTAKTLVIGKEKESVSTSASKTVHSSATSSKTVKVVAAGRPDDGSSGSGRKSPSITISLRGGVADIKVGKSDSTTRVAGKLEEGHGERDKRVERELQQLKAKEQEFLELKAKEKELVAKEKEFKELKAREQELREVRTKELELKAKEKEFKDLLAKETEQGKVKCKEQELRDKEHEIKILKTKEKEFRELKAKENYINAKENEIRKQEENLAELKAKLAQMEEKCKKLEEENKSFKQTSAHEKKEDMENLLGDLRRQLSSMEDRCVKLEGDNVGLMAGLKEKEEALREASHDGGSLEMVALSQKFRDSEKDVGEVEEENAKLKCEIREIREEMEEMYDTFRENEVDEFRDMQKELEITAKNCRILQFKLRKSERRIEQVEADKTHYEERMRLLQNQCESEDTRAHVRKVEDELRMAKEVSVRLHDELDMLDDKKNKSEEDNRHLTELLEQADKKQFRMEMEIDKLRDQIMDLKQELKYAGKSQESSDRKSSRQ